MPESIGKRIARLRIECGWTQQALAARLAVSRVWVSHMEMDLTLPSERTITLLAGLFKLTPYELVKDTDYPQAKVEKLPAAACAYTPLELELALLENDLQWLDRLARDAERSRYTCEVREKWLGRLPDLDNPDNLDAEDRRRLLAARKKIEALPL